MAAAKSTSKAKAKGKKRPPPKHAPVACKSLAEVRRNIDRLDRAIVPLLCERLHFVTQAAKFKPSVAGVIVPSRVEEIVDKVRAAAAALGANPDTLERVYRGLINAFTDDEQRRWRELHK